MLTPQDVTNREFDKAIFGGYDIAAVDGFLEQLSQDYSTLYRESAILKNKLKVLVDKVEEYRSTEDAMRMALLSAKKTAKEMTDEAEAKQAQLLADTEAKCAQMLSEAEASTEARRQELRRSLAEEEAALLAAKRRTADYLQKLKDAMADYAGSLDHIYEFVEPIPAEAPATPAPPAEPAAPEQPEAPSDTGPVSVTSVMNIIEKSIQSVQEPEAPAEAEDTKVMSLGGKSDSLGINLSFDNLQFGDNYSPVRK